MISMFLSIISVLLCVAVAQETAFTCPEECPVTDSKTGTNRKFCKIDGAKFEKLAGSDGSAKIFATTIKDCAAFDTQTACDKDPSCSWQTDQCVVGDMVAMTTIKEIRDGTCGPMPKCSSFTEADACGADKDCQWKAGEGCELAKEATDRMTYGDDKICTDWAAKDEECMKVKSPSVDVCKEEGCLFTEEKLCGAHLTEEHKKCSPLIKCATYTYLKDEDDTTEWKKECDKDDACKVTSNMCVPDMGDMNPEDMVIGTGMYLSNDRCAAVYLLMTGATACKKTVTSDKGKKCDSMAQCQLSCLKIAQTPGQLMCEYRAKDALDHLLGSSYKKLAEVYHTFMACRSDSTLTAARYVISDNDNFEADKSKDDGLKDYPTCSAAMLSDARGDLAKVLDAEQDRVQKLSKSRESGAVRNAKIMLMSFAVIIAAIMQ